MKPRHFTQSRCALIKSRSSIRWCRSLDKLDVSPPSVAITWGHSKERSLIRLLSCLLFLHFLIILILSIIICFIFYRYIIKMKIEELHLSARVVKGSTFHGSFAPPDFSAYGVRLMRKSSFPTYRYGIVVGLGNREIAFRKGRC